MSLRGPVLAAIDLNERATHTLEYACRLASDLNGPLIVCHVLPESVRVLGMLVGLQTAPCSVLLVHLSGG